jgi:hypothetical protein
MEPSADAAPWSVSVSVPGHEDASIEVTFKTNEEIASPGLAARSDFGGIYPSVKVLLRVDK